MERMKKWFASRKMGSSDNLDAKTLPGSRQLPARECQYELTSVRIKQLLEKKKFQKIVDSLREFPREYLLHCLQSFPFKALNRAIPESFAIWETLLTKLHNSEEGYIPLFPYAACDELVLEIAWLLEKCQEEPSQPASSQELVQSCKRVLKKVFMQYNEVLENLYKEQEKVQHALYTLRLHVPLGSNQQPAPTLHLAITEEVKACLEDYTDIIDRLEDLSQSEMVSLTDVLREQVDTDDETNGSSPRAVEPVSANPSQLLVQERLYHNQCVLTTMQPSRRHENLPDLLEILNERICGDKEVLAIFAGIRQKNESICSDEPLGPWLRRYQHAVECAIMALKDIEKELEITITSADSPVQLKCKASESEENALTLPVSRQRSISLESERSFSAYRRHSAAIVDDYLWEEDGPNPRSVLLPSRLTPGRQSHRRPRSASPHKIFRISTGGSDSCKSMDSNGGSNSSLTGQETSASVHDLNSTREGQAPMLAFTRVQSLKTNQSVSVVAGKRKKKSSFSFLPNSLTNLSTSTGNVSSKRSRKSLSRSGSGELEPWDVRNGDAMSANQFMLQQELEYRNKELLTAREVNQDLKKKVRELTDRLSDQAQRQLQDSEKFEDILLGSSRPTVVVQRYQELYSQGRVEALDAIVSVLGRDEGSSPSPSSFTAELLLDVLKFAYSSASSSLDQLNSGWRKALQVEEGGSNGGGASPAVKQLESAIGLYLRRVSSKHDTTAIEQDVKQSLLRKYSECTVYAQICVLDPFLSYLKECARLAWDLCMQTPRMTISFSLTQFSPEMHWRFFDSDKSSDEIVAYLWPTLIQASSGVILFRGCVLT